MSSVARLRRWWKRKVLKRPPLFVVHKRRDEPDATAAGLPDELPEAEL